MAQGRVKLIFFLILGFAALGGWFLEREKDPPMETVASSLCTQVFKHNLNPQAQIHCLNGDVSDQDILLGIISLIKSGNFKVASHYLDQLQNTHNDKLLEKVRFWKSLVTVMNIKPEESEKILEISHE